MSLPRTALLLTIAALAAAPVITGRAQNAQPETPAPAASREVHVLRVELLQEAPEGPLSVLVDGEPLRGRDADAILEIITASRGRPFAVTARPESPAGNPLDPGARRGSDNDKLDDFDPGRRGGDRLVWPGRNGDSRRAPLTDEQIDGILDVMADFAPAFHENLTALRTQNPDAFRGMIERRGQQWLELVALRNSNPDAYRLQLEEQRTRGRLLDLQIRYSQAREESDGPETPEMELLKEQLREQFAALFDIQQQQRQLDLQTLETQLADLKARLADRAARRDELIQQRLDEAVSQSFGGFMLDSGM